MFWKRRAQQAEQLNAGEIATQVSEVYIAFNEKDQLIKPRSSLPLSWFVVRECFHKAYEKEHAGLTAEIKNSYHHVYRELAFFVEDDLCASFNSALDIAVKCRVERMRGLGGKSEDAVFCRRFIAPATIKVLGRDEIWEQLSHEVTCPRRELMLIANTLIYCSAIHRTMWDEWVAFTNLIEARAKT